MDRTERGTRLRVWFESKHVGLAELAVHQKRRPRDDIALATNKFDSPEAILPVWNACEAYFQEPVDKAGRYAVPPREKLAGLPPALTIVVENDPLRFETIEYAEQLKATEVYGRLADYKGAVHSFMKEQVVGVVSRALLDTPRFAKAVFDFLALGE
jgi:acetyl esterase/lipase